MVCLGMQAPVILEESIAIPTLALRGAAAVHSPFTQSSEALDEYNHRAVHYAMQAAFVARQRMAAVVKRGIAGLDATLYRFASLNPIIEMTR